MTHTEALLAELADSDRVDDSVFTHHGFVGLRLLQIGSMDAESWLRCVGDLRDARPPASRGVLGAVEAIFYWNSQQFTEMDHFSCACAYISPSNVSRISLYLNPSVCLTVHAFCFLHVSTLGSCRNRPAPSLGRVCSGCSRSSSAQL